MIGFARNSRVQAGIEAMADFQHTQEAQRQFTELLYQADSRRMIAKVEVTDLGLSAFCGH